MNWLKRMYVLIFGEMHDPYLDLSLALRSVLTPEVAQELTEAAKDGELTWADWLRVGRHAGLKSTPKD